MVQVMKLRTITMHANQLIRTKLAQEVKSIALRGIKTEQTT
jgi:hypothetical protein